MVTVENEKYGECDSEKEGGNRKRGRGWNVCPRLRIFIKDPPHSCCLRALRTYYMAIILAQHTFLLEYPVPWSFLAEN